MNKPKLLNGMSVVVGALFVFLLSRALVTQAASVWTSVPIEPHRTTTSDLLSPGYNQAVPAGNSVTFTHVLTNVNNIADSFVVTATSSQGWPVELYGPTETLTLPVQLEAGFTTTVLLQITVPSGVVSGTLDSAIITATSQTSPTLTSESIDTTVIQNPIWYTYLPLIVLRWPPVPYAPVLNPIENAGASTYLVRWNTSYGANTYTLEESTNSAFANPVIVFAGPSDGWAALNHLAGTYYYRVKGTNDWGDSAWSNVQSATVLPSLRIIRGQITYQRQSHRRDISYTLFVEQSDLFPLSLQLYLLASRWSINSQLAACGPGSNYYYRVMYENLNHTPAYTRRCRGQPHFQPM